MMCIQNKNSFKHFQEVQTLPKMISFPEEITRVPRAQPPEQFYFCVLIYWDSS